MANSEIILANAERFYVIERMTEKEVAQQVGVHERTIRRWKKEHNWDVKKDQYFQTASLFHKEMYNFARKLMISIEYDLDNGNEVNSSRMYTFAKILPFVLVVNVFNPDKHESVADVTKADIIGGVDSVTGKRTGLQTFKDCYSLFGYFPKTIIAPVYCEDTAVVSEMQVICDKIRAIGIVDAPVGTTVQDAIKGRGPQGTINFNTSSDRIVLCYPHLKVYDSASDSNVLEPYSQRLAGVMAAKDVDKGYHWSPSNTEIKGIIGVEKQLTSMINDPTSEVNTLNEAGIVTVFNSYGTGFKTWGNRSAAYPTSTNVTNFINIRRTADILHESVEYSMLQFIDYPIDNGLIESITETVNSFIRTLIGRGALIDGKCTYNADKNPVTEIANGHILFDVEFMPPVPAERITFESFIDIELLKSLGA